MESTAGVEATHDLNITGGTLISVTRTVRSTYANFGINIGEGLSIVKPVNGKVGSVDGSHACIADSDENPASRAIISSVTDWHFVTFTDGQGNTLKTEAVRDGGAAAAPADPVREGYIFDDWDRDFRNVTEDLIVKAKWKEATSIKNAKVVLSATSRAYNGKVLKPAIKSIAGKALKEGTDYTAAWSSALPKDVGSYTVTITGKGNYTGVAKATYQINPKRTSLKKVKKPKKGRRALVVKWKKQKAKMSKSRVDGYEIMLATNKKFTKGAKTVTVKGYKKASKKVTKLAGGKKYFVKIRTYKKVGKTKCYSAWSKVKKAKTKK